MRAFLRLIDLGCLLVAFVLAWGALVEPRVIDVERVRAPVPGLPPAWEGAQVGFLSDLQVGMANSNESTVRRMVASLVEARPAVVLLGGDLL